jgi:DNA-binding NarL/FixJ family response regulator
MMEVFSENKMTATSAPTNRIIIADDIPHVRNAMRTMLTLALGATVVGEAGTANELLDVLANTTTDVIIMDHDLTGLDDEAVLEEVRRRAPESRILVCSVFDGRHGRRECPIADFVLSKSLGPDHWIKALNTLLTQQPPGIINVAVEKTPEMRAMIEAHPTPDSTSPQHHGYHRQHRHSPDRYVHREH